MSSFRAATFAALVVFATVLAVPLAGAIALTDAAALPQQDGTNVTDANATDGNVTDANATDEPSVGAQVSSFLQTSSASATSGVEDGMFEAEYETADNRTDVVDRRADRIDRRIDRLRDRKQDLAEREGELNEVAYTARMSRIVSELESLERQINGTETKARESGADADRFDRMRANVSELRGPKVDAVADAIPGRGPPDDAGPGDGSPGNGPPGAGAPDNASAGGGDHPGNGRGPSGDDGPGNDAPGNGGGDDAPGDGAPGNGGGDDGSGENGDDDSPGNGDGGGPGNGAGGDNSDNSAGGGNPGNGPGAVLDDGLPFVTLVWS